MARTRPYEMLIACAVSMGCIDVAVAAGVRAKADVTCKPMTEKLQYDCVIKLMNARTSEPLTDMTLTVGADMPSMPMMHNVRPVKATPAQQPGVYQVHITLEMHGDWALQLDIAGPVRDRVVKTMRFEPGSVTQRPASPATAAPHRH